MRIGGQEQLASGLNPIAGEWLPLLCFGGLACVLCVLHLRRLRRMRGQIRDQSARRLADCERSARQIQEGLLQSVMGVVMQIHAVTTKLPRSHGVRVSLEAALTVADRLLAGEQGDVCRAADVPSDDDLCVALCDAARCLDASSNSRVAIVAVGHPRPVKAKVWIVAYRITQEAIKNALRHAQASKVTVDVIYGASELKVRVRDNGNGFLPAAHAPTHGRHGLAKMQYLAARLAGSLSVLSVLDAGTSIEFRIGARRAYERQRGWRLLSFLSPAR